MFMGRPSHKEINRKIKQAPNHYAGQYPPQRSYEHDIEGYELLAFRWLSKTLGCRVYLKFTMKGKRMWLVSLHEDRKGDEGK